MSTEKQPTMEQIVSFCKRRGFVYPSSEIYGGFAAIYDYGPYGTELANNVKKAWWKSMVQMHTEIVGLDSAIFTHPRVWEASGHVGGFADPLAEDKESNKRYRVDHLLEEVGVEADEKMTREEIQQLLDDNMEAIKEKHPEITELSDVKQFNLLVKSNLGDFTDKGDEPTYLRGETAQGIFINFKNVVDSTRVKIPFGIAQIGKSFRNEITARQFIFRTREFEQMEMQYFVRPEVDMEVYEEWKQKRWDYYVNVLGIKEENLQWSKHENLVFYCKEAYDIEYRYPFGFKELEGLHARGNYDLSQHTEFSGQELQYHDQQANEKYVPHVVETAVGVGRTMLAVLTDAYTEEDLGDGKTRTVMKFAKSIAPIKVAVFPLMRNKPELVEKAKEVFGELSAQWMCEFDDNGNVGKRYRRQDEIGTPYCVTVDFDTLEKGMVTVRDRDTMEQESVPVEELKTYLMEKLAE